MQPSVGNTAGTAVVRVAWMRMMGADSVAYHEHTVVGRGDDPVLAAAAYYASRGETPMAWGGRGRRLLGLDGEVDLDDYRAIFGPGGAHHPSTGLRLVGCLRPGLELVVSPSKSVAELGVIGRAEDMHLITDAERDATLDYLDYLDRLVSERGGRRGRAQVVTSTGGLIWATARHATTRAGDPQVHDHVLIVNAVFMADTRGGWKGLDTALVRNHLHAATAVGRMAAAAKAVELGYAIEADPGPSGRLGGWTIAGIPAEVCAVHSTRSAQITAAVGADASYAARSMAARTTRDRKAHEPVAELMARWQTELCAAGHPPADITAAVDADGLAGPELTAPGGRRYRAGDKVMTLAPGPRGAWVTSQPAEITAANPHTQELTAVTPDGQQLHMGPDDIGADRLAHGYAITAHRAQGATVDVAHVLDDGGGRELAYVAMSRARHASHVYVTAANADQAAERLTWAWDQQRRQTWITNQP